MEIQKSTRILVFFLTENQYIFFTIPLPPIYIVKKMYTFFDYKKTGLYNIYNIYIINK